MAVHLTVISMVLDCSTDHGLKWIHGPQIRTQTPISVGPWTWPLAAAHAQTSAWPQAAGQTKVWPSSVVPWVRDINTAPGCYRTMDHHMNFGLRHGLGQQTMDTKVAQTIEVFQGGLIQKWPMLYLVHPVTAQNQGDHVARQYVWGLSRNISHSATTCSTVHCSLISNLSLSSSL